MAEMLTDLLQNIYKRIAQLGKAIQGLKTSLDELNESIDEKIENLTEKMEQFTKEIETTQTKHLEVIETIGEGVNAELENLREGLGLEAMENLIDNLESFSKLAEEVLNQDTVNLLLSEAIQSVKTLKSEQTQIE
jgi:ABC-type transporter Mla subunit MlaD